MGGCFSVSLSCDQAVNQVSSCLCAEAAYVHNLQENFDALQIAMRRLKEKRGDLLTMVRRQERRGLQRLTRVQGWLSRVDEIEPKVVKLLDAGPDQIKELCLCGYASRNCVSNYRYGKEVFKIRKYVESLESELETFEEVTQEASTPTKDERPIQPTVGTETMLEKAWTHLMEDEVGTLGLYGMGGVGKTTLLTQINNKFCKSMNEFDVVIWVVVSQDLWIERIQEEIGKKLDIFDEKWRQKRQDEKASDILKVLKRKKFVLLLDDIWKKVNLTEIGVPIPNKENGCKVAFTTRSRDVCGRMGAEAEMEVRCLASDVAWGLFQKKVGKNTLNNHQDIPELAKIVAEKCRGLPLALNIIGETMASKKTVEEWYHSIDVLTSSAAEFPGMEDEILPILKLSYDNLKGKKVKLAFLYCALFPEDYGIDKRDLIDYWVGEGIIDGNKERDRVENEGFEIIGTLVRACLLEENETVGRDYLLEGNEPIICVKMHDVVREMALWIASIFGDQEENYVVKAGAGLCQMPKVENWKAVDRMSLMQNAIEYISNGHDCPKLLTLLLNRNLLMNISGGFFRSMPALVVLDLSWNDGLTELPEDVAMLVSLKYLNLSHTGIRQLLFGLEGLRNLVYLNLDQTKKLQSIDGISNLLNLQKLRLLESGISINLSFVEELRLLEHLNCLAVSFKDGPILERFLSIHKLAHRAQIIEFGSSRVEIKIYGESKRNKMVSPLYNRKSLSNSCFQNLCVVKIEESKSLRDLTWLLLAPNVNYLTLHALRGVKEIISKEKMVSVTSKDIMPFGKLESLELVDLPELESIYWDPLPFPSLKNIKILGCPKLRRLPLNYKSAEGLNDIVAEVEWMKQAEWEDEDIENRLLPLWLRL